MFSKVTAIYFDERDFKISPASKIKIEDSEGGELSIINFNKAAQLEDPFTLTLENYEVFTRENSQASQIQLVINRTNTLMDTVYNVSIQNEKGVHLYEEIKIPLEEWIKRNLHIRDIFEKDLKSRESVTNFAMQCETLKFFEAKMGHVIFADDQFFLHLSRAIEISDFINHVELKTGEKVNKHNNTLVSNTAFGNKKPTLN